MYAKPRTPLPKEYLSNKDVYIRKEKLSGYIDLLPAKEGDKIEFLLSKKPHKSEVTPQGIKPSAFKAALHSYCATRSLDELQSYFSTAQQRIDDSSTRMDAVNSIMMSDSLWFYIFNVKCSDTEVYKQFCTEVMDLVFLLANHMDNFPSRRRDIVGLVVEKNMIENMSSRDEKESTILRFAKLVMTVEPALLKKVLPLLSKLVKDSNSDLSIGLYEMLLKACSICDLSNWHDLTQIPTIEELFGDPLEKVKYLKPVLLSSGYESTDHYLNVYYRLLRTECFSAIQKGIADMKAGQLDARDMSVYEKVSVTDINMEYSSIMISLQFSLKKPVRDWKKSRKLMFGNLLCVTIKGDFSDPIWLTVADRNDDVLQQLSVIGVELISFHDSDTDAAGTLRNLMLNSGKMIMAESPTYFQSFKHVLSNLKDSEISKFCLVKEIVYGEFRKSLNCIPLVKPHLRTVGYENMDDSQKKAFLHALESTLGIIQGPPGTGKTYVGAKLAHMFLCLQGDGTLDKLLEVKGEYLEPPDDTDESDEDDASNKERPAPENPPILILTYKNHALDEFLKHCIKFCDKDDITRIGSQSKEEELNDCLLHNKMKTSKIRRMHVGSVIEEIQTSFSRFASLFAGLQNSKVFSLQNFIRELSQEQLLTFIDNAIEKPWKSSPKAANTNIKTMRSYYVSWKEDDDFKEQFLAAIEGSFIAGNQVETAIALKVKNAFEHHWLPNKSQLIALTQLQQRCAPFFDATLLDSTEDDFVDDSANDALDENIDDLDEDYINEQLSLRISAFDGDYTSSSANKFTNSKSQKLAKLKAIIEKAKKIKNLNGKSVFCLSDFPSNCAISFDILKVCDLWSLSEHEKYSFIFNFLHSNCNEILSEINQVLEDINILQKKKEQIDHFNKLQVLKTQKIVGATIIGASVHLSLISKLAPKIVVVEEAAEVLEACLVAVLSRSVKKLILIGDHKQLKPQVDTYHLRREHNFHISMMERLIKINFKYEKLLRQGRMRPEFSSMLKDIYPEYKDFPDLAVKRKPTSCLRHSMFFWSHQYPENKDRSVKNQGEANMVVALALFFIASGISEERITIICAYLGQVQLVRKLFRQVRPTISPTSDATKRIDIRTVDEYQGDENDFVIVSLTRSNPMGKIGFLKEIERRCVAQSRAKCGLYYIGNANMFKKSKTWKTIMGTMKNLTDIKLPIKCYRHPDIVYNVVQSNDVTNQGVVSDQNQLMYYVQNSNNWCKVLCNSLFPCQIEAHRCKRLCTPRHDDSKCHYMVPFTFLVCQHRTFKPCYVEDEDMKCKTKISVTLPKCGHAKEVQCHDWTYTRDAITCNETCSSDYDCPSKHACSQICGRDHSHLAEDCPVQIEYFFPKCEHKSHVKKVCGKPFPKVKCKFNLKYESKKCGHEQSRKCSQEELCVHPCSRLRPDCGHQCAIVCHKSCLTVGCGICAEEYNKSLDAAKRLAKEQLERCKLIETQPGYFDLQVVSSDLLSDIKEKCDSFLSLYSAAKVKEIIRAFRIKCPENSESFWAYAAQANGIVREELYKLSSGFIDTDILTRKEDIFSHVSRSSVEGFELVKYGCKRIALLPGNEHTLLVADVLLGDSVDREILTKEKKKIGSLAGLLGKMHKDSVITKSANGPATFTVYRANQLHLKYIVHFTTEKVDNKEKLQDALRNLPVGQKVMNLSEINLRDVSNPLIEMVQKAVALYKGDCVQRDSYAQAKQPLAQIKCVGIVVNHKIELAYEQRMQELQGKEKYTEIYAYHATKPENIANIIENNLDPQRHKTVKPAHGNRYGGGCYFSEHPQFSYKYGKETMLIFKLLLVDGKYRKVEPDEKGFCRELVLQDASMFKPQFVLHF